MDPILTLSNEVASPNGSKTLIMHQDVLVQAMDENIDRTGIAQASHRRRWLAAPDLRLFFLKAAGIRAAGFMGETLVKLFCQLPYPKIMGYQVSRHSCKLLIERQLK